MEALAITSKGIEDIAAKEIKELINAGPEVREACVVFKTKEMLDLCRLCYASQSIDRVLLLFDFFDFKEDFFEKMKKAIEKIDFKEWLGKKSTFRVKCQRTGEHGFSSQEIEERTGELIIEAIKKKQNYKQGVNLEEPDVVFFVYIFNSACYIGVDFSGFDMHKRNYNIFVNPKALRATIAYSMIRIANYREDEALLDPFAGSGTIPIEAAFFICRFPVNFYSRDKFAFLKLKPLKKIKFSEFFQKADKEAKKIKPKIYCYDSLLRNLYASKKNAKIAGMEKAISLSRVDVEWLDTKFEESSVDKIITNLPLVSKINEKEIEKMYNELFHQAEYILKKNGRIAAASNSQEMLERAAEKKSFRIADTREVWSGKQKINVFVLERKREN